MPQTKHPLPDVQLLTSGHLPRLSGRSLDAHKGQFGHLLLIGGDRGFAGAALLSAESALRSGAGLVSLATRSEHVAAAAARLPEVMTQGTHSANQLMGLLARATVLLVGPGLGQGAWGRSLLSAAANAPLPQVWDADALNLLAQGELQLPAGSVITPHPGEAARLLGISTADIQADRPAAALALSKNIQRLRCSRGPAAWLPVPTDGWLVVMRGILQWPRQVWGMSWPAWLARCWCKGCRHSMPPAWRSGCMPGRVSSKANWAVGWRPVI